MTYPFRTAGELLCAVDTGRSLPGEEVLTLARDMAAKGFEVMPIGCVNFDSRGYCLGHEESP